MNRDVVCCLSPAGASAIAVVGLRGPSVWSRISPYFTPSKQLPALASKPQLCLGKLQRDGMGDEVILTLQGNEEHQEMELQLHGGPGVVQWCMQFLQELGCQQVEWNEWSTNELWNMLPLATTRKTAGILLDQCQGVFDRETKSIQDRLSAPGADPTPLLAEVDQLLAWESLGAHLVVPWKIVLAGLPNVGKSSLLNALLGYERAITSPIPGTTRDLVTATLAWNGFPLEFIDTAGLRQGADALESAGMEQTHLASNQADMVLWLIDLSQPEAAVPDSIQPTMLVGTKADLPRMNEIEPELIISATLGQGLKELLSAISAKLIPQEPKPGQPIPILPAQLEELHRLRHILRAGCR